MIVTALPQGADVAVIVDQTLKTSNIQTSNKHTSAATTT
jgi:hypothetical protein